MVRKKIYNTNKKEELSNGMWHATYMQGNWGDS